MGDFLKEVVGFCSHAGTLLSETEGLKSGGSSEAFDLRFLEQFESLDGTFYRLPLVNPLRQSLEGEFGPKIDQILERNASRLSGQRDIANKLDSLSLLESSEASNSRLKLIAQEIIDTPQFQNFKSQMVMKAKTAVAIQLRSGLSIQVNLVIISTLIVESD